MKQFAFPLSVKCANEQESDQCEDLLKSLGYKYDALRGTREIMVTNYMKNCYKYASVSLTNIYNNDRHHINHFNPALIRDIAAACTNDTWQEGEMALVYYDMYNTFEYEKVCCLLNDKICETKSKRPTLAEICAHHGYEIKGRDIVKKTPLSAKAPILFDLEKWDFISIDQIQANGVSLEHHIDVEIKLKKALKEIEDLRHEITAWEVKYENIKQVVNR
jgi:hypothetical protein